MKGIFVVVLFLVISVCSEAQIHVSKLVIESHETFRFDQSDILVADTLIMKDSSRIVLNTLKKENFLHSKVAIIGNHCIIDGSGVDGSPGRAGLPGNSPLGPCRSGTNGRNGTRGLDGASGINLFLYLDKATFNGKLIVRLHGGHGGAGGKGGEGGSGGSGTVHCNGGDGGAGGNAGNGANGGNGGTLTIHCPVSLTHAVETKIQEELQGGHFGQGGRGGYGGSGGSGPRRGKNGAAGADGTDGLPGKSGTISLVHD
jgi:hypothetical protein